MRASGAAFLLATSLLCAQQASNTKPQPPAAKTPAPAHRSTARKHTAKKTEAGPQPTTVDIINGTAHRTVVFNGQTPAETQPQRIAKGRSSKSAAPGVTNVEIINGTRFETRTFHGTVAETSAPRIQHGKTPPVVVGIETTGERTGKEDAPPVVIGVESSGLVSPHGTAQPVVVGVASIGTESQKLPSQTMAVSGSPKPSKRPPYRRPAPPASR
jgi:hypothetical protein